MLNLVKNTSLFLLIIFLQMNVFSKDLMHLPNASSIIWCMDEHAKITLEVLDELRLTDQQGNIIPWNNEKLKLIIICVNLNTDLLDNGVVIHNFFGGIRLSEVVLESFYGFYPFYKSKKSNTFIPVIVRQSLNDTEYVNQYTGDTSFNRYPDPLPNDNKSDSKGFHFDNMFSYDNVVSRWDSVNSFVSRMASQFEKSTDSDIEPWFCLIGLISHAVEDFYCHSNWTVICGYYGTQTHSFDTDSIPTWEEFSDPDWLSSHRNFDTSVVLTKFRESNYFSSPVEFYKYDDSVFINGGLQTGNWKNHTFPPNSNNLPWEHRHPGARDDHDIARINQLFGNQKAAELEYEVSMSLAKKAAGYWIKKMLSHDMLGWNKLNLIHKRLQKQINKDQDVLDGCEFSIRDSFWKKIRNLKFY